MKVVALSTGSCGNAYIIEIKNKKSDNQTRYIMLDCGFSYKFLIQKLEEENLRFNQISYLIITHEHMDHIKGLNMILKKHPNIQLIISQGTYEALSLEYTNTIILSHAKKFQSEDFELLGIEKDHDGKEPLSIIIKEQKSQKSMGFFTDLGEYTPLHTHLLSMCNIVFLETNYDDEMIRYSKMNYNYLMRLQSSLGHLSNNQAAELCKSFVQEHQTIILSHISENVNTYELAYSTIKNAIDEKNIQKYKLLISFQKESTGWIE